MDTISVNCLVKGEDPLGDVFLVKINKNEHIAQIYVDSTELRLWKVDITLNKPNEKLKVLENKEYAMIKERLKGMKLVAFKKIIEYFSEVPKENHLIPFSIKISHGKLRKSLPWIADPSRVSLNDIKHKILNILPFPQDMTADILTLHFSRENDKSSEELEFKNDKNFQEYLKYCIMTSSLSLKVQLGTVCDLFELPSNFQEFSKFSCGVNSLEDSKAEELPKHLYKDLKLSQKPSMVGALYTAHS
ncbi:10870_t:CDS:2 [Racocetra fulgida]|uniref:10870_t:CDS:1 n=1 Tax=Racocetra fulgida TaxID=60492 RepID=A0A9N9DEN3_9GLOM|nr:10870_t:CDS:2 [Racocetra fulgida]